MSTLPVLGKSLTLAALVAGSVFMVFSVHSAEAQQTRQGGDGQAQQGYVTREQPAVGGYSLTLRDIWGPAKMPPAPHDFGPHFDYPPQPLNSVPLHDPYPN